MAWWIWVVAGLVLLGLEALTPGGFFILFFGVGAVVVGVLAGAGLLESPAAQTLAFSILSVVSLLLFRKPLLQWMRRHERPRPPVDALESEVAVLLEDLPPGGVGKAELRGSAWSARTRLPGGLPRGQRCRIERVDGLTLWLVPEGEPS